jgi:antitoxin ParD1/3/4
MTTVTLNLSPEVEAQVRSLIAQQDVVGLRLLLADTLAAKVEAMLSQSSAELDTDEFESVADQLEEEITTYLGSTRPILSDYAVSRAGIYTEHL